MRLVNFTKTNGQAAQMFGVQMYEMDFTAAAEFVEDAWYTTGGSIMQPDVHINTKPIAETPKTCGQDLSACFSQTPLRATKGDRLRLAGKATFEKRESGWRVVNLSLTLPEGAEIRGRSQQMPAAAPAAQLAGSGPSRGSGADATSPSSICAAPRELTSVLTLDNGGWDSFVGTAYYKEGAPSSTELSFGGWGDHYYSYLRFELQNGGSSIRNGEKAYLCLFATSVAPNDPQLEIGIVTDSWTPTGLSINSRPSHRIAASFGPVVSGWNAVDISGIVAYSGPS